MTSGLKVSFCPCRNRPHLDSQTQTVGLSTTFKNFLEFFSGEREMQLNFKLRQINTLSVLAQTPELKCLLQGISLTFWRKQRPRKVSFLKY